MKSGKQRRAEMKAKRIKRVKKKANDLLYSRYMYRPNYNTVAVKPALLTHVCTICHLLPTYYNDKAFTCRRCGTQEVWKASQQKWWYEIAKGRLESTAIHCRPCRKALRKEKSELKAKILSLSLKPPHPNEAFFKKRYD